VQFQSAVVLLYYSHSQNQFEKLQLQVVRGSPLTAMMVLVIVI